MNKSQNIPPAPILIGAVLLLTVVFLGAFTFSFVKSKVLTQSQNNSVNLFKPTTGNVENLPSGSIVKTKEEGIAVCKKSGVDYCWSAVAVSFNDLSVCKMAQDVKQCEADAQELIQGQKEYQKEQTENRNK